MFADLCRTADIVVENFTAGTADRLGVTLAGFVRPGRFTLYAHPGRVDTAGA